MADVRWSWRLLRCGAFRLDGGGMFGMIPRTVWSRVVAPDERNRIPLQTNSLLLEREGMLVVVEAGIGNKQGPKERDIYAMEERSVLDALHEAGARPEDVSCVLVTHLHFDHAGGLTRTARAGEGEGPRLSFPNAEIVVQAREWEDARANRSTMHKTYLSDHLTPEVRERVRAVHGAEPLAAALARGCAAESGASALAGPTLGASVAVGFSFSEVRPGIDVFRVPGHTWGQQAIRFREPSGRWVVFVPDVMPTAWHAGGAYNLAYDVEPYVSMQMRALLLATAAREGWLLALDHDPGGAIFTVEAEADRPGAFRLVPAV